MISLRSGEPGNEATVIQREFDCISLFEDMQHINSYKQIHYLHLDKLLNSY